MSEPEGEAGEVRDLPGPWRGATPGEWAGRFGLPRLEIHHRIDSTNSRVRALALEGSPPFTTVIADRQTAGRGRGGKTWHSEAGSGLWMSLLLPLGPSRVPGALPLAVGVVVARSVERATGLRPGLKWPNDLWVERAKLAGVLCESAGADAGAVAVGIGINLREPPGGLPDELDHPPAFVEGPGDPEPRERSGAAGAVSLEVALVGAIVEEARRWLSPTPSRLHAELRREWEIRDCLVGRLVRLESGAVGVCHGVDTEGAILVAADGEAPRPYRSGSVRLEGARASAPTIPATGAD